MTILCVIVNVKVELSKQDLNVYVCTLQFCFYSKNIL